MISNLLVDSTLNMVGSISVYQSPYIRKYKNMVVISNEYFFSCIVILSCFFKKCIVYNTLID